MKNKLIAALLATAFSAIAGVASALTITTISGECASDPSLSGCSSKANRSDLGNIGLNQGADGSFYSLGVGRSATVFFGQKVTGQLSVSEVTFNRRGYYEETALVYGGAMTDSGYNFSTLLGSLSNKGGQNGVATLALTGRYDALRFVDTTAVPAGKSQSADGFDIDSLSIAAVPLPASALLLLGGLGGLGAMRRRKG